MHILINIEMLHFNPLIPSINDTYHLVYSAIFNYLTFKAWNSEDSTAFSIIDLGD